MPLTIQFITIPLTIQFNTLPLTVQFITIHLTFQFITIPSNINLLLGYLYFYSSHVAFHIMRLIRFITLQDLFF